MPVRRFQVLVCNFQPDCPEGEEEMTCPAFFNFDVCDDVVGCGWTDRSPGFLVKSVNQIAEEGLDPGSHGPTTNTTGGTEGKMVFVSGRPGDNGDNDTVVEIVSPTYQKSDAR